MKTSKTNNILKLFQWILVIAAYGYLIFRLATYDDWSSLGEHFASAGMFQYVCLSIALILFPFNIMFEAMKWRYLLSEIEPMTFNQALRQTYFGFIGAFLTPNRIGDYPARVTLMKHRHLWLQAVTLGFVGTLALAFLQVLAGLPSCIVLLEMAGGFKWLEIMCAIILLIQILLIGFYPYLSKKMAESRDEGKIKNTLEVLSRFSHKRFFHTLLLSLMRYIVYCIQLWLVMSFCGIVLSPLEALIAIPSYYLLVTVTPSVPIADAAVRGSWSVIIFSLFTQNIAAIAIAAILLWILNTILPMIVGTLIPHIKE